MLPHEMMKTASGKINRSGFHHFLTSVLPVNRTGEVGRDVLGGVIVVILSAAVVLLMRLILGN
jgi:hypothetical protein